MQHTVLCGHPAVLRVGWRQRYLQPLKNVFCSFNSSSWGGVEVCITYLSPVAESKIVHWVICYRRLDSHQPRWVHVPPTLSGPAYPRPPSHKGLLISNSSFTWVRSAVLIKSLFLLQHMLSAGWWIMPFDPKIHWNGWEFFYCLPGTLS